MITPYSLLLARCGLSHREAAAFHEVRLDTVKSWSSGRNPAPPGAIAELRDLYRRIERVARKSLDALDALDCTPDVIELGLAADDAEAQSLGWPCVGAQAAMIGVFIAGTSAPVRIVQRGSMAATAARPPWRLE